MRSHPLHSPPATVYLRPERKEEIPGALENAARALSGTVIRPIRARLYRPERIISLINAMQTENRNLGDAGLKAEGRRVGMAMRSEGFNDELLARSFALVQEAAWRTLGMRHFETQFMGGIAMMKGMVAEMETGEGKTLTATLAAGTAALAGIPVHVICVNDYLTTRDCEWMGPVYRMLGLRVGSVTHDIPPRLRREAYGCDVVYCNNKEIAFDYLRDKLTLGEMSDPLRVQAEYLYSNKVRGGRLLMRGLHFAIADEADSLLIDESRTPLIISGTAGGLEEDIFMEQAVKVAGNLSAGDDYNLNRDDNVVELTEAGLKKIRQATSELGPLWKGTIRRNDIIRKALAAICLFHRDIHYLVRDGKVQIIDEYTGRLMPDRSWERGIHQLIEIKEGCEITSRKESLARMTYQRFFRRYLHLCGMTGTAYEISGELWNVYGLAVQRIPTNRPLRRVYLPGLVLTDLEKKYGAVRDRVLELSRQGRPVLIGTRSVAVSEELSRDSRSTVCTIRSSMPRMMTRRLE